MKWKGIPVTDGTGQRDREPEALKAGYFDIDEHSFENLLAMGADFAAAMKFYNLRNMAAGDWGDLFDADEAVVMAAILSIDPKQIESDFMAIPFGHSADLLQYMLNLARTINRWFVRLSASRHESGELLARKLERLIHDKLAPELHNIYRIEQKVGIPWVDRDIAGFAAAWDLGPGAGDALLRRATIDPPAATGGIKNALGVSFHTSSNAISYLKAAAAECLPINLESGLHEPSMGLFIVFLKLYEKAQRQLNRFTSRHLEFYYRKMLKAGNRSREPKSCYLLLDSQSGDDRLSIEKDTAFSAGHDAGFDEIVYTADETLVVSGARLEALATLYLQHDELISPASDLGYVARIKADQPSRADANSVNGEVPRSWPLFGAQPQGGASSAANDARIGFCVASPVLLLEQGKREIGVTIEFEPVADSWVRERIDTLNNCDRAADFNREFGLLFARYLLTWMGCLTQAQKDEITAISRTGSLPKSLGDEVGKLLHEDWQGLFHRSFRNSLRIELTAPEGWLEVRDYYLQPLATAPDSQTGGFRITFELDPEAAPVTPCEVTVHGGDLPTELPVMRCLINPQSNFYAYSVFRDLLIASLRIDVEVSGLRNLLVYNQHGQLDPGKPFQPFGPLPDADSYFVFGNFELARKQLKEIRIGLDWTQLPRVAGGFEEHYLSYDTIYSNEGFKADFSALVDGRWASVPTPPKPRFNLFETAPESGRVGASKEIKIDRLKYVKPLDAGVAIDTYHYDLQARNGFFRLSLAAPETGFGHGEYGPLLTRVLSANVKLKKNPEPVPNPPYTPTLGSISLSYRASTAIFPSRAAAVNTSADKIFHLHPFGTETVFPSRPGGTCHLLPQYSHEGNLFLGLSGADVHGPISLLFHLSRDQARPAAGKKGTFEWFYLADDRWRKLEDDRILADGTYGFLAPGIVTLEIPTEITRNNKVMPGDCYWLRVSAASGLNLFQSCYSIRPHAVKVVHKVGEAQDAEAQPASESRWSPLTPIPGIGSIRQAYPAFGGREAETDRQLELRISERLRHKNRALMPWDYEQLILERFPEIIKAKCFNSTSGREDRIKPGQVLIAVVPDLRPRAGESCTPEMIDARKLEQIEAYVKSRSSAFAEIKVRNPQYERVQVRCKVKFVDRARAGIQIERLNQDITNYICPWNPGGYRPRFGWSIRRQDIESNILNLGYVDTVTDFSMLHITVDNDGYYSLFDTARGAQTVEAVIEPRYPWGLAIPMEKHFIETTQSRVPIEAEMTGVDELAVGSTFIVVGSSENGETE